MTVVTDPRAAARAARRLWTAYEPVHAVTYFAPEARAAFEAAGLRGFWRGYFAGRAAPLGAVGPGPVLATFFGFAPAMVVRALPDVWTRATPEAALRARLDGAVAALRRVTGEGATDRVAAAADLLRVATEAAEPDGRALGAANRALDWPDEPYGRLWHATTVLREHRGDGHIAALVAAGLSGVEALALRAGRDGTRATYQPARGWTDEEWDAAAARLADRGWLSTNGTVTAAGRAAYAEVERVTDEVAAGPWRALGPDRTEQLFDLLLPVAVAARAELPADNPIGLPQPGRAER